MASSSLTIRATCRASILAAIAPATFGATEVHRFTVDLDGRDIGTHVFTITREGPEIEVRSAADFRVKVLGVPVYRYRHDATEHWSQGCLVSLDSRTERNGRSSTARWQSGTGADAQCESAFAYWQPSLLDRPRLLNPETGRFEKASLEGDATRRRLSAESVQVELRYSADGRWSALESSTPDGRRLRYREAMEPRP